MDEPLLTSAGYYDINGAMTPFMSIHDHRAFEDVLRERRRQEKKFPDQRPSKGHWTAILGEEYGEVCRALCEQDMVELERELVQVAAVALRWLAQAKEDSADC